MRVRRLLLFILVAVNLTLVCQGHAGGEGHTGVHLALLGEPHVADDEAGVVTEVNGGEEGANEWEYIGRERAHEVNSRTLKISEAGRSSDPAVLGGSDFSSLMVLAVALLSSVGGTTPMFSMRLITRISWGSRAKHPPEPPPPQATV